MLRFAARVVMVAKWWKIVGRSPGLARGSRNTNCRRIARLGEIRDGVTGAAEHKPGGGRTMRRYAAEPMDVLEY
jgi:hypothetical protein